jgi:hypothetical protein
MTERADTFIAAQFNNEIDERIAEGLVMFLSRPSNESDKVVETLVNHPRFRQAMQNLITQTRTSYDAYSYQRL